MTDAAKSCPPDSPAPTPAPSAGPKPRSRSTTGKAGGARATKRKAGSAPSSHKYRAKGLRIDGHYFPSHAEGVRYEQLKALAAEGAIADLELQPAFPILVNNIKCTSYVADFRYSVVDDRGMVLRQVVEDVKGVVTDIYKLKRKLVSAAHGLAITEIPAARVSQWAGRTS